MISILKEQYEWLWLLSLVALPYVLVEISAFLFVISRSIQVWLKKDSSKKLISPTADQAISVIIPAYNEERVVVSAVRSILGSDYPFLEVIVVNDGSQDRTLDVLMETFALKPNAILPNTILSQSRISAAYRSSLCPNLIVLDKVHSGKGKADALNCGISYATNPLVCVVDADSILESDSLQQIVQPFLKNPNTIAVGGAVRCNNYGGPRHEIGKTQASPFNPLIWAQKIEYARIFFLDRVVLSSFNLNYIISGAFGLFSKRALIEVGGYQSSSLAEDMDLTMRLHRHYLEKKVDYHIAHAPDANCWTEVPFNLTILQRQRARWHAGFIKTFFNSKDMLGSKSSGALGLVILPYCMVSLLEPFFVLLSFVLTVAGLSQPILAPFVIKAFLISHLVFSVSYLFAISLENRTQKRASRQAIVTDYLTWLVFGRFYDSLSFFLRLTGYYKFFKKQSCWGKMERSGFRDSRPKPAVQLNRAKA